MPESLLLRADTAKLQTIGADFSVAETQRLIRVRHLALPNAVRLGHALLHELDEDAEQPLNAAGRYGLNDYRDSVASRIARGGSTFEQRPGDEQFDVTLEPKMDTASHQLLFTLTGRSLEADPANFGRLHEGFLRALEIVEFNVPR